MNRSLLVSSKIDSPILYAFSGLLFSTWVSANPIGDGKLEPDVALKQCIPSQVSTEVGANTYGIDGHQWLTLRVAMAATDDFTLSHGLAYYAQYPDIDSSYNAIYLAPKIHLPDWQEAIMGNLHSLHGGGYCEVYQRRRALQALIDQSFNEKKTDVVKIGLLIHAFGDSYAHTRGDFGSEGESAYGKPFGHLIDSILGNDPDKIKNAPLKARAYAKKLFSVLSSESTENSIVIDMILEDISNCRSNTCGLIDDFYSAEDEEDSHEKLAEFTECMNSRSKKISKEKVLDLVHMINLKIGHGEYECPWSDD